MNTHDGGTKKTEEDMHDKTKEQKEEQSIIKGGTEGNKRRANDNQ